MGLDADRRAILRFNAGTDHSVFSLIAPLENAIPLESWTHIMGSFNNTNHLLELHVNGARVAWQVTAQRPETTGSGPVFTRVGEGFVGQMDEVQIWNEDPSSDSSFLTVFQGSVQPSENLTAIPSTGTALAAGEYQLTYVSGTWEDSFSNTFTSVTLADAANPGTPLATVDALSGPAAFTFSGASFVAYIPSADVNLANSTPIAYEIQSTASAASEVEALLDPVTAPAGRLEAYYRFDDGTHTIGTSARASITWGQVHDFSDLFPQDWKNRWVNSGTLRGSAVQVVATKDSPVYEGSTDTDGDNIADWWELRYFGDLTTVARAVDGTYTDYDEDGLTDLFEFLAGLSPRDNDTNNDGTLDGVEDLDGDGLVNNQEQAHRTNPLVADTDDDGVNDLAEVSSVPMSNARYSMSQFPPVDGNTKRGYFARSLDLSLVSIAGAGVTMPAPYRFDRSGLDWTVELRAQMGSDVDGHLISYEHAQGTYQFDLGLNGGAPYLRVSDAATGTNLLVSASGPITNDDWHRIAARWEAATGKLTFWIDAMIFETEMLVAMPGDGDVPGVPAFGSGWARIGADLTDGYIDEVKIWNKALSDIEMAADEFSLSQADDASLLAYYRFDDGGDDVEDFAQRQNEGFVLRGAGALTTTNEAAQLAGVLAGWADDMDLDGLPDAFEDLYGIVSSTNVVDTDGDDIPDAFEDADDDGLNDYYEYLTGLNPHEAITFNDGINDADRDSIDGDGVSNLDEQRHGTSPWLADTDDDGFDDLTEIVGNSNPARSETPDRFGGLTVGSGEYVTLPKVLKHARKDWTIGLWINPAAGFTNSVPVWRRSLTGGTAQRVTYELGLNYDGSQPGVPYVRYTAGEGAREYLVQATNNIGHAVPALTTGTNWTHLAGQLDTDTWTLSLFVNGRLNNAIQVGQDDGPDLGGSSLEERLGDGFEGLIAEARVGTGRMTDLEVYNLYELFGTRTLSAGADIVFILDTSGSMSGAIADVRLSIEEFIETFEAKSVDAQVALLDYVDNFDPRGGEIFTPYGFTRDAEEFKTYLDDTDLCCAAEAGTAASFYSLLPEIWDPSFRDGAQKIFILITDENMAQEWPGWMISDGYPAMSVGEVKQLLIDNDVTFYGVAQIFADLDDDGNGRPDILEYAEDTGGARFELGVDDWDVIIENISENIELPTEPTLISEFMMWDGGTSIEDTRIAHAWLGSDADNQWLKAGVATSAAWHQKLVDAATPVGERIPRYDTDNDGATNNLELTIASRSDLLDTDDDGISDVDEIAAGTHPNFSMSQDPVVSTANRALDLGLASALSIPMAHRFDNVAGPLTVEAWINPATPVESGAIIQHTVHGFTHYELGLQVNVPYVKFQDTTETWHTIVADRPLVAGEWAHVAVMLDVDDTQSMLMMVSQGLLFHQKRLGFAGQVLPMHGTGVTLDRDHLAQLGDTTFAAGTLVDEIRVWEVTRTESQIHDNRDVLVQANHNDLTGYYRFDDAGESIEDFAWKLYYVAGSPHSERDRYDELITYEGYHYVVSSASVTSSVVLPAAPSPILQGVNGTDGDDIDTDGMADWFKDLHFREFTTASGIADSDLDDLSNLSEYYARTDPWSIDTDGDGILDGFEDLDGDGLINSLEQRWGSRPDIVDTDDDGVSDFDETLAGGMTTVPTSSESPRRSGALSLDGTGYVALRPHSRFAMTNSWSVEAWVNLAEGSDGGIVLKRGIDAGSNYELGISSNLTPYVRSIGRDEGAYSEIGATSTVAIARLENWYHIAGVYDAEEMALKLYVDGILRSEVDAFGLAAAVPDSGSIHHRIGEGFEGLIDEVRIWNSAQTQSDLARRARQIQETGKFGLVGYYRFDDFTSFNLASPEFTSARSPWVHGQVQDFSLATTGWSTSWRYDATFVGAVTMVETNTPIHSGDFVDSDGDGLPDWWEIAFFGNDNGAIPEDDTDNDGINNLYEYLAGLNPIDPRSFGDTILDGVRDSDGDQLVNQQEQADGTLPNEPDTDDDGLTDYEELTGTDDAVLSTLAPERLSSPLNSLDPPKLGSMGFDGTGRVVINGQDRHSLQSWTVEAWVYPSNNANGIIVRRAVSDESGQRAVNYELGIENTNGVLRPYARYVGLTNGWPVEVRLDGQGATEIGVNLLPEMRVPAEEWTHLVATYNQSNHTMRLYIDGYLASYRIDAVDLPIVGADVGINTAGELSIGGGSVIGGSVQDGFEGYID
ncbi:MAG: VWA domain-containing protein, partial [Kiritimatiellae bacterium]|nr:VWA domain-containing protein [Kiritimatiellia bacterium]